MSTTTLPCPACDHTILAVRDEPPVPGAVIGCVECGGLFAFTGAEWEPIPAFARRALIDASPEIAEFMTRQQEWGLWRARDVEAIRACVTPFLIALSTHATTVDLAAEDMATALWKQGFHTHPYDDDPESTP